MADVHHTTGEACINGTRIFYEMTGAGHPLVLVHSGMTDRRMWDEQVQVFAQHYQVIHYDMCGYGKSSQGTSPFSHAQDLYGLLTFLGISHAFLVGCSLGSVTVIDFVLQYPGMIDGLILVTATPGGYEFTYDGELFPLWNEIEEARLRSDAMRGCEGQLRLWVDGPYRSPDQVNRLVRERVRAMNMMIWERNFEHSEDEQPLEPPAISRLKEIGVPTLVLIGDLDDPNVVKSGELLAAEIVDATCIILAGTAHFPNMERPDEFNHLVLDFLPRS
ncbi:alpha/beta fold hydrolase [Ktedonobacter robiniae]|uniref:alpha/beta fold hydrolase n=1 Tax=Ktedonobacter robiniae TaxID=2778365 RepID=UPI001914D9FA|nr:alpha/beta hydrolase [Ktedonobacter robiniae]